MISRVYLKDCLSFEEVDLEFKNGLNIFTGPSGAGKSILMQAVLSLFALTDVKANMGEVLLNNSNINDEVYDLSFDDDIIIKSIKFLFDIFFYCILYISDIFVLAVMVFPFCLK